MSDVEICNLARDGKVNDLVDKINADPGLVKLKDSVCILSQNIGFLILKFAEIKYLVYLSVSYFLSVVSIRNI